MGWRGLFLRYGKMVADTAWIMICNRLKPKIDDETIGEVRKITTPLLRHCTLAGIVQTPANSGIYWWPERESNLRHTDFQSVALPTELSGLYKEVNINT